MKAAVLERRGKDGVSWRDFPDPARAEGETILRVAAGSLNRVDLYMRDNGAGITHTLPQVMGVDAAGVIAEAEPGSGLKAGHEGGALHRGLLRQMPLLPRGRPAVVPKRADHGRAPSRRLCRICRHAHALRVFPCPTTPISWQRAH